MSADLHFATDGATIAYQLTGEGAAVGYAHGVLLSRKAVAGLGVFDVQTIGRGHRLLTYDQRGHGESTGRPIAEDYTFERAAHDLLGLLDAAAIDKPINFAGSSLGAAAALHAAVAYPGRFGRLALLIPPVAWETGPQPAKQWYFDAADSIDSDGPTAWRQQWDSAPPLPIFADYPQAKFHPDVPDELLGPVLRGAGLSDLPDPDNIKSLPHPTVILAWDTDPLHPISTAEQLHELIPDSTLRIARSVADVKTWANRTADFFSS